MSDYRVYPTIERLSELSRLGRTLSLHPPYQRLTPLTGKHRSQQRGRGLDFIELRHYYQGDDVRCIDWKVTQRTGQPYLRVYSEERDKNIALLVDLRTRMFFASDGAMKSAIASEIAAIIAGSIVQGGDRMGALILTDSGIASLPFRRGEKALLALLNELVLCNSRLPDWSAPSSKYSLYDGLSQLSAMTLKESQCFIISDFSDYQVNEKHSIIDALAKRNSLIGLRISDPLEIKFPGHSLVIGNTDQQVELKQSRPQAREKFEHYITQHRQALNDHFLRHQLALLDFTTRQDAWLQMQAKTKQ
ncbi:hypothetical protein VSAK1_21564 [Vibrio mediterranei AK1]|uniref:DUF58 domain-containing protein n=1 Tax=Vibrio TaxID=662 RepID=UPI0001540EDE|nr:MULTISPECIES: DUF58 domain-containing protein [Vibrio]EDL54131.1 hypothetical protein VSAK1_21564 [Vibrio mediterranei AK1]MCF4176830.1 DUF58 domain-containing protein [Vibrio sp. McD22-P3]